MQRRLRRNGLIGCGRGLILGIGIGLAFTWFWPDAPRVNSSDVNFARNMGAHHAQAVNMSVTLLKRTVDPEIRLLAQDILLTQQAQIGQMQGWLMAWRRPLAGAVAPMAGMNRTAMGMASSSDEVALATLPVRMAETRFLVLMRRHHQGGVAMAKAALGTVRRPEVRMFAQRVAKAQTSEIQAIDALLDQRLVKPDPAHDSDTRDHE